MSASRGNLLLGILGRFLLLFGRLAAGFFFRFALRFLRGLFRARGLGRFLAGVIGDIPTRALELNRGRGDQLLRALALGTFLEGWVGKLYDLFEAMTALLALVLIQRHTEEFYRRLRLLRYSRNGPPRSSRFSANSTVAFRKPSLSPAS